MTQMDRIENMLTEVRQMLRVILGASINDDLASTADEVITLHQDGTETRRAND